MEFFHESLSVEHAARNFGTARFHSFVENPVEISCPESMQRPACHEVVTKCTIFQQEGVFLVKP
jgi:hypothetical protein